MDDTDWGALPVAEGDRLVGMITDHDSTLRVVAKGKTPNQCKVREVKRLRSDIFSRMRARNLRHKT